jgi:ectoine hydroxylase-related dioxygenase (phytanoyl-CoA dioxygenase family)
LWCTEFLRDGFAVVPDVIDAEQIACLINALEDLGQSQSVRSRGGAFAVRNLLDVSPEVRSLGTTPRIRGIVTEVLGEFAFPVRGILFDKTPKANWKVPWHQDVTVAVAGKVDVEGFGPWSTKAGVLHVQPPASVLEQMLSIRIHLDPCGAENGALKVVAGSHRLGRLPESDAAQHGANGRATVCVAGAGDAVLMRPLLLHASSPSASPGHRRVIHLDFAASPLPGGLQWYAEKASA